MTKQTRLGKTDIYVNPIGLGTNVVGGHNLYPNLDTAFIYGPGRSEKLVGEVIKELVSAVTLFWQQRVRINLLDKMLYWTILRHF